MCTSIKLKDSTQPLNMGYIKINGNLTIAPMYFYRYSNESH